MNRYEKVKEAILKMQENKFPPHLHYHGTHHVLDVLHAAESLGVAENIPDDEMELLKLAVLFHDAGYMYSDMQHEEKSCEIASSLLSEFGFTATEISVICNLILATRTPQQPTNHLEEIICDADMDYLGRDDYYVIAETLRKELSEKNQNLDPAGWMRMQINFLEQHTFFTKTAIRLRHEKKLQYIEALKKEMLQLQ